MEWKSYESKCDWNDLAVQLQNAKTPEPYDIILADEVQDFSANQVRALVHQAADPYSIVFVLDAAQRIYPRGFTWTEVGISSVKSQRLTVNYRNTMEICRFASPLLEGLNVGDDGTLPDFNSCVRHGSIPIIIEGRYSQQVEFAMNQIESNIDTSSESVAFLQPLGGSWFDYLKGALRNHSLNFVEITRENDWPTGPVNIALCTMHSAKGLEFDHVFVLGLNDEVTPYNVEPGDSAFENLRRLLAVAITRAKRTVTVGYKPEEASGLVSLLDPTTYRTETLWA
jgi:superfamily I DNA/RNA helicase